MLQSEAEKLLGSSAGVPMIDNYSMTRQLYGAHIYVDGAGWDCNHWCSPGVPEWEIYTLFKAFKQYNIQPLPPAAVSKAQPQCVPVVIQSPPPEGWMVRPAPDSSSSSSSSSSSVGIASQKGLYQEQYEGWYGSDY
ncbi:hypothetical protein OEZ85_003174 [Tetradesmus obliquus]|uniref:Uncharacterized protein n=1 Tax=Tetradesmus obliquus TaxID=3088 RepID=A0ABY8U4T7_TETOB|nr:hypothetical protein OEZ85_003174 [Tetradesmus obliquus]